MNDPDIDKQLAPLNEGFRRLRALQEDPQPGLFTWQQMMRDVLLEIRDAAAKLTS